MTKTLFVPFAEVRFRDPRTHRMVPDDGVIVAIGAEPVDPFWTRRVLDGDGKLVTRSADVPVPLVDDYE